MTARNYDMPNSTLNAYLYKGLRDGQIIHLKRNYYVTRAFFEEHRTDQSYLYFLANTLLKPSYISLEAALQYYGLFAEAINYTITSVTPKLPRIFKNRTSIYVYRKLQEKLFSSFQTIKGTFDFTIALPHKAVFDYLYYKTHRFTTNLDPDLLEELRIDTDILSPEEKKKLNTLLATFSSVTFHL